MMVITERCLEQMFSKFSIIAWKEGGWGWGRPVPRFFKDLTECPSK